MFSVRSLYRIENSNRSNSIAIEQFTIVVGKNEMGFRSVCVINLINCWVGLLFAEYFRLLLDTHKYIHESNRKSVHCKSTEMFIVYLIVVPLKMSESINARSCCMSTSARDFETPLGCYGHCFILGELN